MRTAEENNWTWKRERERGGGKRETVIKEAS
jgi:hypothetical protein